MHREEAEARHPATPIVRRIEETHQRIRSDLNVLEKSDDLAKIRTVADELPALLKEHFRDEEKPGGLFEEVASLRPALAPQLDLLRSEHLEILRTVEGLQQQLREAEAASPGGELQQLHDDVRVSKAILLKRVHQHERVETGLVAATYYAEDGGSG